MRTARKLVKYPFVTKVFYRTHFLKREFGLVFSLGLPNSDFLHSFVAQFMHRENSFYPRERTRIWGWLTHVEISFHAFLNYCRIIRAGSSFWTLLKDVLARQSYTWQWMGDKPFGFLEFSISNFIGQEGQVVSFFTEWFLICLPNSHLWYWFKASNSF